MKTAKVWIAPYDKWNRINSIFDTFAFVLMMITIFFHPFWLSLIMGLAWAISSGAFFIFLWLNERKKHQLAKAAMREKQHIKA